MNRWFRNRCRNRPEPDAAREAMVGEQLRRRGIVDERVLGAMAAIPRDAFVPDEARWEAYADEALPIGAGQTISQPYMVALMTELLDVQPGDRILEIGTDRYQAAVLAWLGARVTSIERQTPLIPAARARLAALRLKERVEIRLADGSLGDAAGAPWDGIIVTAAAPAIPDALREQLTDGGRLVIPVGPRDRQILTVVTRHGEEWTERPAGACVFVPLIGEGGFSESGGFDP
jgi:protein-L-isoaspartate(D-aspartate) O-methyltransferase